MLHLWELLLPLAGKGQPDHGFQLSRELVWQLRGACLSRECKERRVPCRSPCRSASVEIAVRESLGASHAAVAKRLPSVA